LKKVAEARIATAVKGTQVDRRTKQIGVTLCLMAMAFFAGWPFWKWMDARATSASLRARTQSLVEKNPGLQPAWHIALHDVLTLPEAKIIVEAAGEKVETE
jgi:hypothetical protein